MKSLLILLSGFLLNIHWCNANDSLEVWATEVVHLVNALPKTNVKGKGDLLSQTKYFLTWDKEVKKFTLATSSFKAKSKKELTTTTQDLFRAEDLHAEGIIIHHSDIDSSISLRICLANNALKSEKWAFENGERKFGFYEHKIFMGSWENGLIGEKLNQIKAELIKIAKLNSWDENDKPNMDTLIYPEPITLPGQTVSTFDWKFGESDEPVILNFSLEQPALFLDAKNANENNGYVARYLLFELQKIEIVFRGKFSGGIIVAEDGKVEAFKSRNLNSPKIEDAIEKIILAMPQWKPAFHDGKNVRVALMVSVQL